MCAREIYGCLCTFTLLHVRTCVYVIVVGVIAIIVLNFGAIIRSVADDIRLAHALYECIRIKCWHYLDHLSTLTRQ